MGGSPEYELGLTDLRRLICEMGGLDLPLGVVTTRGVWAPLGAAVCAPYLLTRGPQVTASWAGCGSAGCVYDSFKTLMRLIYKAGTDANEESKHLNIRHPLVRQARLPCPTLLSAWHKGSSLALAGRWLGVFLSASLSRQCRWLSVWPLPPCQQPHPPGSRRQMLPRDKEGEPRTNLRFLPRGTPGRL